MKRIESGVDEPRRRLLALTSFPWAGDGVAPYRMDALRDLGWDVVVSAAHRRGPWAAGPRARLVRTSERVLPPWSQTAASTSQRAASHATLAMFESEGHALALARAAGSARSGGPLVIVACWLADLVEAASPARLAAYRAAYRGVDRVVVFSDNQVPVLTERLGLPAHRVAVVPFGVDLDEVPSPGWLGNPEAEGERNPASDATAPGVAEAPDHLRVLAVGRDASRDWVTLGAAATGAGWTVDLYTRARQLEGLGLPPQVRPHGYVDRSTYLALLAAADVAVIPTGVHHYPAGQSVLGEAMAAGVACVVSDTPALASYVSAEHDALVVPPGDASALRQAIDRLTEPAFRRMIGANAHRRMAEGGGARAMWTGIDRVLRDAMNDRMPLSR